MSLLLGMTIAVLLLLLLLINLTSATESLNNFTRSSPQQKEIKGQALHFTVYELYIHNCLYSSSLCNEVMILTLFFI